MPGPVVFFQIGLKDPAAAEEFFREVFEWELGPGHPGVTHATANPHGPGDFDVNGAISQVTGETAPFVSIFVRVADLDAAVKRSTELGGETIIARMRLGEEGAHIALIRGPEKLVFGLVQE